MNEQSICAAVFADRYAAPGETSQAEAFRRTARALAAAEPPEWRAVVARRFYRNMLRGAIGAGRIMANAGTDAQATMVNCFVQPAILPPPGATCPTHAAVDAALREARTTLLMGGGVGYDFSAIPPAQAPDSSADGSPGVCAAIDRFDRLCTELPFAGSRRGAQMAVLRCDHPDLPAFVAAKRGRRRWPTFNLSVAITDAFMSAVEGDRPWTLAHRTPPRDADRALRLPDGNWRYATLPARALWDAVVANARDSAEPGLIFIDTINAANPLRRRETIAATNPCGEQPLPPYGSCVLGPIDLSRLVHRPFGVGGVPQFDFARLAEEVRTQVRMLDNVIDLTAWPLAAHAAEAQNMRRIGVGVTGLADALTAMRLRYDAPAARELARRIAVCMRDHAYAASAALAAERGAFPCFDPAPYLASERIGLPLPPAVRTAIKRYGLRNSHLLSFAPAGSVSLAFAGNCSNGIEPVYDWICRRTVRIGGTAMTSREFRAENRACRLFRELHGNAAVLPDYFTKAADIAPADHVAMQAALQPYVDAAISKTVAVPSGCTPEQVGALFMSAWHAGLKGITVFRPDPALAAVLVGEPTATRCSIC